MWLPKKVEKMRLDERNIVIVETLGDIKSVIQEFTSPSDDPVTVDATIRSNNKEFKVSAAAECDYPAMLKEGFGIVKRRLDAIEKHKGDGIGINPISVGGKMWLDDLITRRLGGERDGTRVRWDLKEGTFFFDPFDGKLTKCPD